MARSRDQSTLHNRVLAHVGPAIVAGAYPPGHVLTLEGLERDYGVSRTVAREAVRVLQSMRLVSSRPRVGVTVLDTTQWSVFDPQLIRWRLAGDERSAQLRSLTELRAAVEPPAAAAAALRAEPAQRERLLELSEMMQDLGQRGELDAFMHHDIEFHRLVLEQSGNEMFAGLADVVAEVLAGRAEHHLMPAHPRREALRLHSHVATAVRDGLPQVAESAMRGICAEVVAALDHLDHSVSDGTPHG
ncbi:FCD domain-containing protein [Lipingzhangella sp. LS1_29]|uniref:FCD domain-containing protein n=1 Tax=Lipingzhangella rawalii TaxID=2055835 RepID=A0ABU2H6I0_9ACTN|nr:FCD domain-containing protein [Lipingzhangella rawalii]MDS1270895.1 FCD domain-containing protein [Lipingzhangella rawalii]